MKKPPRGGGGIYVQIYSESAKSPISETAKETTEETK